MVMNATAVSARCTMRQRRLDMAVLASFDQAPTEPCIRKRNVANLS
jgi:hypothetical protein